MTHTEREQALDDLLVTVVEQGYDWFLFRRYVPADHDATFNKVGVTRVEVAEEEEQPRRWLPVSADSFEWKAATSAAADHSGLSLDAFLENQDANAADLAMQFLVCGEERYA